MMSGSQLLCILSQEKHFGFGVYKQHLIFTNQNTSNRRRGRFPLYRMEQQLMGKQSPTGDTVDLNSSEQEGQRKAPVWDFEDQMMYCTCVLGIAALRSHFQKYFEYEFCFGREGKMPLNFISLQLPMIAITIKSEQCLHHSILSYPVFHFAVYKMHSQILRMNKKTVSCPFQKNPLKASSLRQK